MIKSIFNCTSNLNYRFDYCNSIANVNSQVWNVLNSSGNIFLSIPYLTALEEGMCNHMGFRYITFFDSKNVPVGFSIFQLVHFKAKELMQERVPFSIGDKIQSLFSLDNDISFLICGNLYACGENGFVFNKGISNSNFIKILGDAIAEVQNSNGPKISFSLIKELGMHSEATFKALNRASFLNFNIDVIMSLAIKKEWFSFDTYLDAMNTKYRTRAKAVFKKSSEISNRSIEHLEIEAKLSIIENLYKQVLDRADYNLGVLKARTFLQFKRSLGEDFVFMGYFLKDDLIGFTCSFLHGSILDANFMGLDYRYNTTYKLYQRMLYDFVKLTIEHNKSELRLGRTAEMSKSSIGALPVHMKLFARHRNLLPSKLLKPLISAIEPNTFDLRKPFKD